MKYIDWDFIIGAVAILIAIISFSTIIVMASEG